MAHTLSLVRWAQLITSIAGLIMSSSGHYVYAMLVFSFVAVLIYEVVLFVAHAVGRSIFEGRVQMIIEIVLACFMIIMAIICTLDATKDAVLILALICGYILPALLFITAYSGN